MIHTLSVAEELALRKLEWDKLVSGSLGSLCMYQPKPQTSVTFLVISIGEDFVGNIAIQAIELNAQNRAKIVARQFPDSTTLYFDNLPCLRLLN